MLTDTQIGLVQSSFAQVLPIADQAGLLLFDRIFELAPEARSLFADDIAPQAARTMAAVKEAVDSLDDLQATGALLISLGARHARYGVRPEHFEVVGAALLWTLEQGLGDAFTPEVRDAWIALWGVVTETMLAGLLTAAG